MRKKIKKPPVPAEWFLLQLVEKEEREFIQGDLREFYLERYRTSGWFGANIWYLFQIIKSFHKFLNISFSGGLAMFKNYILIAFRTLKKNKVFSFINISGLAVGLACFFLMIILIQFESSFDDFHENSKNIYRVVQKVNEGSYQGSSYYCGSDAPLAGALMANVPEVKAATRYLVSDNTLLQKGEQYFYENGIYGDNDFFEVFSFKMLTGDKHSSLSEPFSIVISEKLAWKVFKNENPAGKTLKLDSKHELKITGIYENVPVNSHFRFDFIISINSLPFLYGNKNILNRWGNFVYKTYLLLRENYPPNELEEKIPAVMGKYTDKKLRSRIFLQPTKNIHFETHFNFDNAVTIEKSYIYLYSVIAFLILIIACINYMNLCSALYTRRARETGIRKVIGAYRRQLFFQYLGESFIYTLISTVFAVILTVLYLPHFNTLINREISFGFFNLTGLLSASGLIITFVTVIAGSYPAFFISGFSPVNIIKKTIFSSKGNMRVRSPLIVIQFAVSIGLIICTMIVYYQLNYIDKRDIGYSRDNILVVQMRHMDIRDRSQNIKNDLLKYHSIKNVSCTNALPIGVTYGGPRDFIDDTGKNVKMEIFYSYVDKDFIDVFDVEFAAGRNFSEERGRDLNRSIILNETAVKQLGWKEAVGNTVNIDGTNLKVIGIINDFHYWTFHNSVKPYGLLQAPPEYTRYICVKMNPDNIRDTVGYIEGIYRKYISEYPFESFFLDDHYNEQYLTEQRFGEILMSFSLLAVFIAAFGLFGLATFIIENKTKEIGIRKVLGSSVPGILILLSKNFAGCVLLANIIAWPASFYIMRKWLENFAYRIGMSPKYFLMSFIITLIIAGITISYQTIKAARANPADSLKYE